jgi:hypothetical protein
MAPLIVVYWDSPADLTQQLTPANFQVDSAMIHAKHNFPEKLFVLWIQTF